MENVAEFLENIDNNLTYFEIPTQLACAYLKGHLTGWALDWFEVLGYRVVEDKVTDCAKLKQTEQFHVVRNMSELETRFYASSQKPKQKPSDFNRLEPQILDYVEVRHPQTTFSLLQIIDKYEEMLLNRKIRGLSREFRVTNQSENNRFPNRNRQENWRETRGNNRYSDNSRVNSTDLKVKVFRIIEGSIVDAEVVSLIIDSIIKAVDRVVRGMGLSGYILTANDSSGSPYVTIILNETSVTAVWDTGVETSFISEEAYCRYFSYRPSQKTKDRVVTAQGAPCCHLGLVELQIRIREFQKTWEFHILNNMQYQCILAIDLMKESKLTLDFDKKSLIIPDDQIKQLPKVEKPVEIDLSDTKLGEGQKQKLKDLFNSFKGIFSDQPGLTHVLYHEIDTGDQGTVVTRPDRYDRVKQGIIDYHIEKMLQEGKIRPIQSPYSSPMVLTRKNNGLPPDSPEAYRFAIDYRKLNAITKYPRYPLPMIDDLITNIPYTGIMSTLDLKSGYFQLAISPKEIEKSVFITRNGTFSFLRMPFGLSGVAPNFQKAIDMILKAALRCFVMVYMDDVIITSSSFDEHIDHLNQNVVVDVLSRKLIGNMDGSQIPCATLRALALNSREQLIREQRGDPELGHIYRYLENPDDGSVNTTVCEGLSQDFKLMDGLLFHAKYSTTLGELRVYIPKSLREAIMQEFHDLPLAGHLGKRKTYLKFQKLRSQAIANALFENYISRYGAPISLISDNGPQFISKVFEHLSHRKRSLQRSEYGDQKRPTPVSPQEIKRTVPSSVTSKTHKYRRQEFNSSQGTESISGTSHHQMIRQFHPPTDESRLGARVQYDKTRETRSILSKRHSAAEGRPVRSRQTTSVRPCPYYLRSRLKEYQRSKGALRSTVYRRTASGEGASAWKP
ncbi:retrovirus-related Pol polyprotein from transposon 297 [Trichonephila clavipes]|nr:retrovirus-related Pol polyprotein from transposon 297 [Trichonephila clavipes]